MILLYELFKQDNCEDFFNTRRFIYKEQEVHWIELAKFIFARFQLRLEM